MFRTQIAALSLAVTATLALPASAQAPVATRPTAHAARVQGRVDRGTVDTDHRGYRGDRRMARASAHRRARFAAHHPRHRWHGHRRGSNGYRPHGGYRSYGRARGSYGHGARARHRVI